MKQGTLVFATALLFAGSAFGQSFGPDDYLDYRPQEMADMPVLATAHFKVSRMTIAFQKVNQGSYDDFLDRTMQCMITTYTSSQQNVDGSSGGEWHLVQDFVHDLTNDKCYAASAEALMIGAAFGGLVNILQSANVGYRNYAFIVPVAGNYHIEVQLTGDIDKPRNRVFIAGPTGTSQIDDDNPSSNRTKVYNLKLAPGAYDLTTALGSGESAVFHNAGSLTSVALDNGTPVAWDAPIVIATRSVPVLTYLPAQGSIWHGSVGYTVPTSADFPNVLVGNVTVDQVRPLPVCHQPRCIPFWRGDLPYWLYITEAPISFYTPPVLNLSTRQITYFFARGNDTIRRTLIHGPLFQKTLSN